MKVIENVSFPFGINAFYVCHTQYSSKNTKFQYIRTIRVFKKRYKQKIIREEEKETTNKLNKLFQPCTKVIYKIYKTQRIKGTVIQITPKYLHNFFLNFIKGLGIC